MLSGTNLTAKLQSDKERFIAQHKIKKGAGEALEKVAATSLKGIVTIPRRKRSDNEDGSGDEIAAIEQKVRSKGKGGKGGKGEKGGFSNKRQRTK